MIRIHYAAQAVFLFCAVLFGALIFLPPAVSLSCAAGACCLFGVLIYHKIIGIHAALTGTMVAALSATGSFLILIHHRAHVPPSLLLVVLVLFFLESVALWAALSLESKASALAALAAIFEKPLLLVFPFVIGSSLFVLQALKYASFKSEMWDLGCISQAFANTLHGNFFQTTWQFTERNICGFGSHSEVIFMAILPVFALFPHPLTLVAIQSVLVGLSLVAFYFLARDLTASRKAALVFMICFGLYPPLYLGGLYDFHGEALALPFLVMMMRQSLRNEQRSSIVWLIAALACKEYCALVTGMWGIYCLLRQHKTPRRRLGALIVSTSVFWFVGALYTQHLIRPHDLPSQFSLAYSQWGNGFVPIVVNAVSHPGQLFAYAMSAKHIEILLLLLFPTAGLLFAYPWAMLICGVDVLKNCLTPAMSIETQRTMLVVPFIWYGTVRGYMVCCKNASMQTRRRLLLLVALCGIAASFLYSETPWSQRFYRAFHDKYSISGSSMEAMRRLAAIPRQAPVSAGPNIFPHLYRHAAVYSFPFTGSSRPAAYIAIDTSNLLPQSGEVAADLIETGRYGLDWQSGKYRILIARTRPHRSPYENVDR